MADLYRPGQQLPGRTWSYRSGATDTLIQVADDATLRNPATLQALARATAALGLSRYAIPPWLADIIYGFDGQIRWPDGRPFVFADTYIGDLFDDTYCRWLSDFLRFAGQPPRQAAQARILPRLRAIDLALKIAAADSCCRYPI